MGDFMAFRKFVTPLVIQVLFWLGVIGVVILSLYTMVSGGGAAGFLTGLLALVFGIISVRVYCELLILLFRIYDELVMIRTGRTDGGGRGFDVLPTQPMMPQ